MARNSRSLIVRSTWSSASGPWNTFGVLGSFMPKLPAFCDQEVAAYPSPPMPTTMSPPEPPTQREEPERTDCTSSPAVLPRVLPHLLSRQHRCPDREPLPGRRTAPNCHNLRRQSLLPGLFAASLLLRAYLRKDNGRAAAQPSQSLSADSSVNAGRRVTSLCGLIPGVQPQQLPPKQGQSGGRLMSMLPIARIALPVGHRAALLPGADARCTFGFIALPRW